MKHSSWIMFLWMALGLRADQSVTLQWYANPEPDIASYCIGYGTAPRIYTLSTNVGNVTNATVYGLKEGNTWYLAVAARNQRGIQGPWSEEVTNCIPSFPQAPTNVLLSVGLEIATSPEGPWQPWLTNYITCFDLTANTNLFYRLKGELEPITPK